MKTRNEPIVSQDTEPSSLQYEYGAVLAPRPLPVLDSSTDVNVMKLSVSHINSPTHFYAHLQDEEPVFQDLATFLNETYEQSKPVPVARPDVGSFWVARSETSNAWVRVEITGVQPAAQTEPVCSVFHVDSGLVEGVPVSNLRPLVTEILDTPCIALRCRLTGIHPYLGSPVRCYLST